MPKRPATEIQEEPSAVRALPPIGIGTLILFHGTILHMVLSFLSGCDLLVASPVSVGFQSLSWNMLTDYAPWKGFFLPALKLYETSFLNEIWVTRGLRSYETNIQAILRDPKNTNRVVCLRFGVANKRQEVLKLFNYLSALFYEYKVHKFLREQTVPSDVIVVEFKEHKQVAYDF
jgi:hypothetical protein